MSIITQIIIIAVALLHIYFLVLEMFLWDKPLGLKTFGQSREAAAATKVLAANQGLYNGFLATGLLWSVLRGPAGIPIAIFFLGCVIVAGIFGAATVNKKILYVQAAPAAVALAWVLLT